MKQHQTSKDSFARSLIGLSIGIVVLLGGVILLFQNFYISADPNTSVIRNTTLAEPTQPATTSSETDSSNKPQTVTSNSIVPPVLLSLEDKQVISANDSITMPAPAKPRATMASEVEPATISTPIDTSPANAITPRKSLDWRPPLPAVQCNRKTKWIERLSQWLSHLHPSRQNAKSGDFHFRECPRLALSKQTVF